MTSTRERREDLRESVALMPEEAGHLEHHRAVDEAPQPPGDCQFAVVADAARLRSSGARHFAVASNDTAARHVVALPVTVRSVR